MITNNKVFHFYCLVFALIISVNVNYAQTSFELKLNSILQDSLFTNSIAAIDIYDLDDEKYLFRKNEKLLLTPASTLKILTSTAALFFLGKEYNYETKLAYSGELSDGTLNGDIYVIGGCDPLFITDEIDSLIFQIESAGIKKIKGNIYADVSFMDSLFWGKGWMWDDDPSTDAPYLSALNLNNNSIEIQISPREVYQKPFINLLPNTYYTALKNNATTINVDTGSIIVSRNWLYRSNEIIIDGVIYKNSAPIKKRLNVFDPAYFFLTVFKEKLQNKKLIDFPEIKIKEFKTGFNLYSYKRNIIDVINYMNKESDNLSAEMVLRALAFHNFGAPATAENGVKMIDSLLSLAGINSVKYKIVDGSGVSHYNLITAEMLNKILGFVYRSRKDLFEILKNALPVAGVDGTLKERMKTTASYKKVFAKTGTLSGISCLAGYAETKSKHIIAFSIMIQNYAGTAKAPKRIQEKICDLIVNQ